MPFFPITIFLILFLDSLVNPSIPMLTAALREITLSYSNANTSNFITKCVICGRFIYVSFICKCQRYKVSKIKQIIHGSSVMSPAWDWTRDAIGGTVSGPRLRLRRSSSLPGLSITHKASPMFRQT